MNTRDLLASIYQGQTLVFGHRGAKGYAPMNTLPAFELALAQGAHGIELDVHRTRDGYPVIVHDFTVNHTTDGTGLVVEKTLAELKALDAGSWFSEEFRGVRVPTLDEVFEAVGRQLIINVEIKAEGEASDGVEEVVLDCIRRHAMQSRVIVSSFNPPTLKRFRALAPDIAIGFLHYPGMDTFEAVRDLDYEAFHPFFETITAETIAEARSQQRIVNTWTVNDPQVAVHLRDLGVLGLITDYPDRILAALKA